MLSCIGHASSCSDVPCGCALSPIYRKCDSADVASQSRRRHGVDCARDDLHLVTQVIPQSGFKRYQLDKLAFTREPEPRVLSYAARRELGEKFKTDGVPRRLCGAYSEVRPALCFVGCDSHAPHSAMTR